MNPLSFKNFLCFFLCARSPYKLILICFNKQKLISNRIILRNEFLKRLKNHFKTHYNVVIKKKIFPLRKLNGEKNGDLVIPIPEK